MAQANRTTKFLELDSKDKTIRVVEKDSRGGIVYHAPFNHFNDSIESMKQAILHGGYRFHHSGEIVSSYVEVS